MRTVRMSRMIAMLQEGHSHEAILQGMIDEQVEKGLRALHESIMVSFASASRLWNESERKAWRTTDEAYLLEERIRVSMKTHTRGF